MTPRSEALAIWAVAIAAVSLVIGAAWHDERSSHADPKGAEMFASGDWLDYRVTREEWPSGRPSYCDVSRRFDLTRRQKVETLYLNGSNGSCASGDARIPYNARMRIALSEAPPEHCAEEAKHMCP